MATFGNTYAGGAETAIGYGPTSYWSSFTPTHDCYLNSLNAAGEWSVTGTPSEPIYLTTALSLASPVASVLIPLPPGGGPVNSGLQSGTDPYATPMYAGTTYYIGKPSGYMNLWQDGSNVPYLGGVYTITGTPATPTALIITENLASPWTATVSWSCAISGTSFPSSFNVQRSLDNSTWSTIVTGLAYNVRSYTDSTISAATAYWYRIVAVNTEGTATSTSLKLDTPATPAAPLLTNIQIPVSVQLSWTPVGQLGRQRIERSPNGSTGWVTIADNLAGSTSSYTDTSVVAAATYYYRIVSTNSMGSATGSSASITASNPLMALTYSLTYSPIAVTLNWAALTGATGYVPQRSTDNSSWSNLSASQLGTQYVDTTVSAGVRYFYRIQGVNGSGTFYSPTVGLYAPGPAAPAAPTLRLNPFQTSVVDIWWTSVPSFRTVTYAVQRSPSGAGTWTTLASGIYGNFWQDSTLTSAATWDYRIVATDIPPGTGLTGYSNNGATANITVPILAPAAPVLSQKPFALTIGVNWATVSGVSTWTVQRSTDNCQTWTTLSSGISSGTRLYLDSTVSAYTRYWYRVIAVAGGGSAASPPASIYVDTSNAINAGYRFIVNHTDVSSLVPPDQSPQLSKDSTNQGTQLSFVMHFEGTANTLAYWQEVALFDGRSLIFYGWITNYSRTSISPTAEEVAIMAQDGWIAVTGTFPVEQFEQMPAGVVVKQLIARSLPGITWNGVQAGPTIPAFATSGADLGSALKNVLQLAAASSNVADVSLSANLDLALLFANALRTAPILLTDANPYTNVYGA